MRNYILMGTGQNCTKKILHQGSISHKIKKIYIHKKNKHKLKKTKRKQKFLTEGKS